LVDNVSTISPIWSASIELVVGWGAEGHREFLFPRVMVGTSYCSHSIVICLHDRRCHIVSLFLFFVSSPFSRSCDPFPRWYFCSWNLSIYINFNGSKTSCALYDHLMRNASHSLIKLI
jgi:hypothetical protein